VRSSYATPSAVPLTPCEQTVCAWFLCVQLLVSRQLPNGSFPQEAITGVFNRNCMIVYPNYQHYFPLWAFARYAARFGATPF
jgi:hypothetical protein